MLEIKKYLLNNTPEALNQEFGINVYRHPTSNRV